MVLCGGSVYLGRDPDVSGAVLFLCYRDAPHEVYHGAMYTKWKLEEGISLGLLFCPGQGRGLVPSDGGS